MSRFLPVFLAIGSLWFALVAGTAPAFAAGSGGLLFAAVLLLLAAVTFFARHGSPWRYGAVVAGLVSVWGLGLAYVGPSAASGPLSALFVILVRIYWGARAGRLAVAVLVATWTGAAFAWNAGLLPVSDGGFTMDPRSPTLWLRAGLTTLVGVSFVVLAVNTVIREFERLLRDVRESASRQEQSERQLRDLVEAIRKNFWVARPADRRFEYVSPNFRDVWGVEPGAADEVFRNIVGVVHPADRAETERKLGAMMQAAAGEESIRVQKADGEIRWVNVRVFPVAGEPGAATRIAGVAEDITERKALEDAVIRGERMEAVGSLASEIAHDLSNLLNPMLLVTEQMKDRMSSERDRAMMELAEQSARRGAVVLRRLLQLGRGFVALEPDEAVAIRPLLEELVAFCRETLPPRIRVEFEAPEELWNVRGDGNQLHQALLNLCINASHAIAGAGTIRLSAENVLEGLPGDASPQRFVLVAVEDSGHGIPEEIRHRIFEPFFSTKEGSRKSGLGLSSARRIVLAHGGFLDFDSEPGRGTTFRVYLPAAPESPAVAA